MARFSLRIRDDVRPVLEPRNFGRGPDLELRNLSGILVERGDAKQERVEATAPCNQLGAAVGADPVFGDVSPAVPGARPCSGRPSASS